MTTSPILRRGRFNTLFCTLIIILGLKLAGVALAVELLEISEIKDELEKKITALCKFDFIIIDELGYLPLNKQGMFNLFQFINTPYEYRSVIIITNNDFSNWNDFFIDENVAVPVIDRLIHHSHLFMM